MTTLIMDKFMLSVKKRYKDRLINHEKQWPPCCSNKLIRLELVEGQRGESYSERGRRDKTLERTPLPYADLFKVNHGKKQVRKVLVVGDAGIGKTTLSILISEEWANTMLYQEFDLLLLLPLRHNRVASACSLPDLLKLFHSSHSVCESVASYIQEGDGEKVLIVADGWDELSESRRQEQSFLYQLLFDTFPLMSVILTTRPSASASLHRLPCIDRFVEINGFSKADIEEYILSEFSNNQESAGRLLEELKINPVIESICSIPLNCAIICHLWRTLEEALPSTMTELYTKIILNVSLHSIQKNDKFKHIVSLPSFDALPDELQALWWCLCEFAFYALQKDEVVFSQEELIDFFPPELGSHSNVLCFGLLHSAEKILETGCGMSFHFLHLIFQEFLAALYLAKQTPEKLLEICQASVYQNTRFTMVWIFFFGICFNHYKMKADKLIVNPLIQMIAKTYHYLYLKCIPLCHAAFEARNSFINNEVIQFLINASRSSFAGSTITFSGAHTPHDCAAVLYLIAHIKQCCHLEIDFNNCSVREDQIMMLIGILAGNQGKLKVRELNLSNSSVTGKCLSNLFHQSVSAALKSLERLHLSCKGTVAEMVPSISLSCNAYVESGLQALETAMVDDRLSNLQQLSLKGPLTSDTSTNTAYLTAIIEVVSAHCPHLRRIDLSQNTIDVSGASALAKGISQLLSQSLSDSEAIIKLFLTNTNLGDRGLITFVESLTDRCHITKLHLSGINISSIGMSYLSDAVCLGKVLIEELDLSDNDLGLEGVLLVGKMLSSRCVQLRQVNLSRCKLTVAVSGLLNSDTVNVCGNISEEDIGQQLCQFSQNSKVTLLVLDGNSFVGGRIRVLVGFMHLCKSLNHLSSSSCQITCDDIIGLLDELKQLKDLSPSICTKLKSWELCNNKIHDSGAGTLINNLPLLFPCIGCRSVDGIFLYNNPISCKNLMEIRHEDELKVNPEVEPGLKTSSNPTTTHKESLPNATSLPVADSHNRHYQLESTGFCGKSERAKGSSVCKVKSNIQNKQDFQTTVDRRPWRSLLDQMLDFDSNGISKHLGKIADIMHEWEGRIAEELGLTPADITAIKTRYPGELKLQTRAALEKWKQNLGHNATYNKLIDVFKQAGYQGYADHVYVVLQSQCTSLSHNYFSLHT